MPRCKNSRDLDALQGLLKPLHVRGAYGRQTRKDDWERGLDFQVLDVRQGPGPYMSIRDLPLIRESYSCIEFYSIEGNFIWRHELP
jgi:hypothetical protein